MAALVNRRLSHGLPRQHELPVATVLVTTWVVSFRGRLAVKTGATKQQIEDAKERNAERNGYTKGDSNILDFAYFGPATRLEELAGVIVPEDSRIVSKQLLIDARSVIKDGREYETNDDIAERARVLAELGRAIDGN